MKRLLALHPLWLCLACLLLAAGAYVSDSAAAAIAVAPLLFLSATPLLIVVTIGQLAAALSLAYGFGNLSPFLPGVYAFAAAILLAQDMLLPAETRIPSRLRPLWQYAARDLRTLFWMIAAAAAAAALFRPVPIAPALGIAALHALFAWAMAQRHPNESRASSRAISAAVLAVSTLFCAGFLELAARLLAAF